MIILKPNKKPKILDNYPNLTDDRWENNTIYNHYNSPLYFMEDIVEWLNVFPDGRVNEYIQKGVNEYKKTKNLDIKYNKLYQDVANKVKNKLIARGFTTKLLYKTVEFTTQKTGVMSKQRAMMGRKDCYYKDLTMNDSKLFHDIYINLSYDGTTKDSVIKENSYALFALAKELSRLIPIRVIVVNHTGTNTPSCYSYMLKKFGMGITPEEFLFFTSTSKRTFGFAYYDILNNGYKNVATTGNPKNTVSIADFNLDKEINSIITKIKKNTNIPELQNLKD